MTRLAALAAVVLVAGSACGGSRPTVRGGSGVVTASAVGPLRIDVSTQADVVSFAGRPGVIVGGQTAMPGVPAYRALTYGCPTANGPGAVFFSPTGCRAVYYINTDTKRFVAFYSESSSFHTTNGIHPGMAQNTADSLAHQTPQGPWNAIAESSPGANLILPSADGKVEDFQLESRHHPIGLNFT